MRDAIRLLNSIGFFILKTQIMKTKKKLIEKRDKLQKEIDNFKEETFKNGDWIKLISNNKVTVCITDFKKAKGYGFSIDKKWCDEKQNVAWTFSDNPEDWVKMTGKEAEQALIKEAKKKGFKKGVETVCINVPNECEKILNNSSFRLADDNRLLVDSNGAAGWVCIFQDGKWAEIIEDKKPTINGYEMELDGDSHIKFGCAKFSIIQLKKWNEALQLDFAFSNRTIKSITLCSGAKIKAEELKEVVDYLNK